MRFFWKSTRCAIYGFSASLVFGNHVGGYCKGISMQPAIQHGNLLLAQVWYSGITLEDLSTAKERACSQRSSMETIIRASLVFGNHFGGYVYCKGRSMQPTTQHRDLLFVERLSVNWQNLHRGDVVTVLSPVERYRLICKRLVCKEHDTDPSKFPLVSQDQQIWMALDALDS